jgi:UDP-4-amino-4-deoxy-L-arabinose formyltransferase/UDP-glucuronic acid dehydrogenase (UDP-4-keto-hexauronic acid decarboxylating)
MRATLPTLNVLVVAEEGAGVELLKLLSGGPHRVAGVLTTPPDGGPSGTSSPWQVARAFGYPTLPARTVKESGLAAKLREMRVDLLLNVHSLSLIPEDVLAAPRIGSFNMHPGPLPRYAGLNAPSWALYHDEPSHGVTIHHMEPAIDTGAIAYQTIFPLTDRDTGLTVSIRCVREGLPLIQLLLEAAAEGAEAIPRRPQDLSLRQYFGRGRPQGGAIRWARSAREVFNFVRAASFYPYASPWGTPTADLDGTPIGIVRATPTGEHADEAPGTLGSPDGGRIWVACSDDWLQVDTIHSGGRCLAPSRIMGPGGRLGDGSERSGQLVRTEG